MRRGTPDLRFVVPLSWWLTLALILPSPAAAQVSAPEGDFIYHARLHDTLIGISRRLLIEPRRWPEIQARNSIADPRHIPLNQAIRIPYAWLRLSPDSAAVLTVSGDVREGGWGVTASQALPEGSKVETGADGSVTLLMADGSTITLQKQSVLGLDEMRRVTGVDAAHDARLKLQSGRLQTRVKPHGDVGRFEISTPVAVSAVRGTEFRDAFDPAAGNATTETLEGLVAVSGSNAVVPVPADFGTRVERGAAPLPPIRLLPAPDLRAIPETNSGHRVRLSWPAIEGARRYRLQVAPNAEFQSFLTDTELDVPQADLPAPADGSYWLRVRAIDNLGLEGHDAIRSFTQHELPAAPSLVQPLSGAHIVGDSAAFAWSGVGGNGHYRVQIARDAEFSEIFLERDLDQATLDVNRVPPGRYFWRVRAADERGESGDWSPVQQFTQREGSPTPHSPAFSAREMRFNWDARDGLRYHVQIARTADFSEPLVDETLETPNLSTARLRPGMYYARVQTVAEDGTTVPFGTPLKFDVPVPLWLKILTPLLVIATLVR